MKRIALALFALSLAACHDVRRAPGYPTTASATPPAAEGVYDNHAQVWQAHESAPGAVQPPHVVVTIDATSQPDWALWRIHLDATPPVDAVWAIRSMTQSDGALALVPHRPLLALHPPHRQPGEAEQQRPDHQEADAFLGRLPRDERGRPDARHPHADKQRPQDRAPRPHRARPRPALADGVDDHQAEPAVDQGDQRRRDDRGEDRHGILQSRR